MPFQDNVRIASKGEPEAVIKSVTRSRIDALDYSVGRDGELYSGNKHNYTLASLSAMGNF